MSGYFSRISTALLATTFLSAPVYAQSPFSPAIVIKLSAAGLYGDQALQTACNRAQGNTLEFDFPITVTQSFTCNAAAIKFDPNAFLTIASGATITFTGTVNQAFPYYIQQVNGSGSVVFSQDFLEPLIPNTTDISNFTSLNTMASGGFGIIGGAKMSLCVTSNACDSFGISGLGIQDSSFSNHTIFGVFGQTRIYPGSAGPGQANEFDIINVGPSPVTPLGISPYGFYTGAGSEVINTQIACGDPSVVNGNCSYAIDILNNSGGSGTGNFLQGINIAANAINGTTGIDTDTTPVPAIELGRMQSYSMWSLGSGSSNPTVPAAQMYAATTGGTTSMNIKFTNAGTVIEDAFSRSINVLIAIFNNATSYLQITGGTPAFPPAIVVAGSDPNIGLNFKVPGSGTYHFYNVGGGTDLFDIGSTGVLTTTGINGVSCAAGSVSLTTLTITNGLVTHC